MKVESILFRNSGLLLWNAGAKIRVSLDIFLPKAYEGSFFFDPNEIKQYVCCQDVGDIIHGISSCIEAFFCTASS